MNNLQDLIDTAPDFAPAPVRGRAPSVPQSERLIAALAELGYTFRLNLLSDTIEINGEPITDVAEAQMRTQMRDLNGKITGLSDAWTVEAARNAYHPIRDYLTGLVWDGTARIAQLAACLKSDDPPVRYQHGPTCTLPSVYLHRWLIGAVAKALDGAQNAMLVLAGGQGIGKSQLARWLCTDLAHLFVEAPINVSDKDSHVRLMSRFIWEVSELDATTRRADVSALKAFITTQTVTVRRAYARHDTIRPAMASLIGTINNATGFLADETGNRRFYVTTLTGIDWDYQHIPITQLWAEAVSRYRRGEPWRLLADEALHQEVQNREYEAESLIIDWIAKYFEIDHTMKAWRMTAADMVDHLRSKYDIRIGGSDRGQSMEISRAMAHYGIVKHKIGGVRYYVGINPKDP
jgi:predicted P-loop ATPase